jgi:hypothetical protein
MAKRLSKSERAAFQNQFKDLASDLKSLAKDSGAFSSIWNQMFDVTGQSMAALKTSNDLQKGMLGNSREKLKEDKKSLEITKSVVGQVDDLTKGLGETVQKVKDFKDMVTSSIPGPLKLVGIVAAIGTAFVKLRKVVTDTRKELGVSFTQSVAIVAQNKVLEQVAKGFGLELQDITDAQAAIRQDLGASVQESIQLSLNFARTAVATGQTSSELASTLSIMEAVSSASRDVLLNQIQTNAALIGQAGVAPALIMKDLASNAEFFAQFAKDGGMNIINAGVAARKLGLEMSAVASISESLLDFESSIEKQLEASLLIGRQINLDRARQLSLAGDQQGVMKEILKQVGGEAEFNKMNVIQRKALADSVGVNVEQLSRLVRNNTAGATGAAVGAAMSGDNVLLGPIEEIRNYTKRTADGIQG